MEFANRLIGVAMEAAGSNRVINVCLIGACLALSARSMKQQKYVDAMEAEKESLLKSNKAMKKTLWSWKQELYAESQSDSGVVPLARLKAIYGETPSPETGDVAMEDAKSSEAKVIVV